MPAGRQTIVGVGRVKNRAPAPIQITAEQIIRESRERQEAEPRSFAHKITDKEELNIYRMKKRREFEDSVRMQRHHMGNWMKYARWEELQVRRRVFERALEIDPHNSTIWTKYVEMEQRNKNINHARNIWNRAIELLPRVDQFWYKYAYMEEILGNVKGAREIYDRWMKWNPDENAWMSYIRFEMGNNETEKARQVYLHFVQSKGTLSSYEQYAKWEEKQCEIPRARQVYEKALEEFPEYELNSEFYVKFAKFEVRSHEYERARAIFKLGLERVPKEQSTELYHEFTTFEKGFGETEGIEEIILDKRRRQYRDELEKNPHNFDAWFDLIRLEESAGNAESVRSVYREAISKKPPYDEKRFWRRYIYLWVNYAVFEELESNDVAKTRSVYKECLAIIPHKTFTFAKIWILFAKFEIRQRNFSGARKILGQSIGLCPKARLFKAYIQLEMAIGEMDRCRILYSKFLDFSPQFAEFESNLHEFERTRAIFELAIAQPQLDMPELIWKKYIDFEIDQKEYERARTLLETLLKKAYHVKVFVTYAQFEAGIQEYTRARAIYVRGNEHFSETEDHESRAILVKAWKAFEDSHGSESDREHVSSLQPRRVKKQHEVFDDAGNSLGNEDYYDYVFPDEAGGITVKNEILEMASQWKQQHQ